MIPIFVKTFSRLARGCWFPAPFVLWPISQCPCHCPFITTIPCSTTRIGHIRGDIRAMRIPGENRPIIMALPGPGNFPVSARLGPWSTVRPGLPAARAWLSSSIGLMNWHCVGQLPEIVDGDAPHSQRGCDAQAWGVSELLRVWKKITAVN